MKVDIHFENQDPGQIQVYHRCRDAFRRRNIDLRFLPDQLPSASSNADLFILQKQSFPKKCDELRRPIIYEERADSSMPMARHMLSSLNLIQFNKVSLVRSDWLNIPTKRIHLWLLENVLDWPTQRTISSDQNVKLNPGINFGMYNRLKKWADRARLEIKANEWQSRPIDVLLIGKTQYQCPAIDRHRLRFLESLQRIKNLKILQGSSRIMSDKEYFRVSNQAKIVLSPWGYGELCSRDFEAMFDRCILIKPLSNFIETLDNILVDGKTYISCKMDASNLEDVIRLTLTRDQCALNAMRHSACRNVLKWWDNEIFVTWWCDRLSKVQCEHDLML